IWLLVKRMPLPFLVGVKSMRKLPGTERASYQISILLVPSCSKLVVFCTNVAVLYQDFEYFFCMAWTRSSVVVILAANVSALTIKMRNAKKTKCGKIFVIDMIICSAIPEAERYLPGPVVCRLWPSSEDRYHQWPVVSHGPLPRTLPPG